MLDGRYPSRVRRAAAAHRVGPRRRARSARARAPASSRSRTPARSPTAACSPSRCPTAAASASSTRRWSTRRAPARRSCSARRPGGSRRSAATASSSRRRPACPGAVPFWKGDGVGRPKELGAGDRRVQPLGGRPDRRGARARLRPRRARRHEPARLPARAAGGHARRPQRPHDRRRALPRRDRRLAPVRALARTAGASTPPGRSRSARASATSFGLESDAIWSDDGIIVHLPDADEPPGAELVLVEPDELEDKVVGRARRAARCSARASARTRPARCSSRARIPGKRTPLWQQRLKSQTLLEVAKRYAQFPVSSRPTASACATCSTSPASTTCCARCTGASCRSSRSRRRPPRPSPPRCSSTTSRPTCTRATRRTPSAARLRCRSTATSCASCSAQEELRELDRPGRPRPGRGRPPAPLRAHAGGDSRRAARRPAAGRRPDRRRGRATRVLEPARRGRMLDELDASAARSRRARRRRGALDRRRGRRPVPRRARRRAAGRTARRLHRGRARRARAARAPATRGPTGRSPPPRCASATASIPSAALRALEAAGDLVRGELRPGGTEREWCDPEVLRRLRRASLAALRKEIEPADQRALRRASCRRGRASTAHPPAGAGVDRLREVLVPLQGLALPAEVWERDVLPRRVGAYSPTWMDQLCASGEVVWIGAGALGRRSGRVALYFRDDVDARRASRRRRATPPAEPAHDAVRERLRAGACFFTDLLADVDVAPEELQEALWDLVWAGEATNDAFAPLRAPAAHACAGAARAALGRAAGRRFASPPAPARRAGPGPLVAASSRCLRDAPDPGQRRRALAELLLERYGIVTREQVLAEGVPGGFSTLYDSLAALETLGVCRRGYFVEGLGGAQFALPGAVERLRAQRDDAERGAARARGGRPRPALRRGAAVAQARRRGAPAAARRRSPRRAGRRGARALPRALGQGRAHAGRARRPAPATRFRGRSPRRCAPGASGRSRWSASTASPSSAGRSASCWSSSASASRPGR